MRCLVFQLGDGQFALPMRALVEILPLLPVRLLAHAPAGIAGVINYRGQIVPVVDLCLLALGRPSAERSGTRLLVLRWQLAKRGEARLLALMAERAVSEQHLDPSAVTPPPLRIDATPYLAGLIAVSSGLVQLVEPARLLPEDVADLLYAETRAMQ